MTLKLIVGLGNPGPDYFATRHNAGFWFLDNIAENFHCDFSHENKFHGEVARLRLNSMDCRLFKPATYMNESGRAVAAIIDYFDINLDEIIIAHDEIDLAAGMVRLKQGGGHGGHNGLRDIISCVDGRDFWRLRIGVGHPGHRDGVTPHVLGRPDMEDQRLIEDAMERALQIIPLVLEGEMHRAMNELHSCEKQKVASDKTRDK